MTTPPLAGNHIEAELPGLLAGVSVVALVPATDLRGWAAEMAWRVARAAAREGRRTALVDCFVDAPTLHTVAGAANEDGITDVFEYGASLNRIVQQQPQANLFFVPAGTYAADAEPLVAHPRWRRLSAGFRHEEALLLLYVSAAHVGTLAAEPDGMIVLSPIGLEQTVAEAPLVAGALARGVPLLAVIADNEAMRISGAHRAIADDEPSTARVADRQAPMAAGPSGRAPMAGAPMAAGPNVDAPLPPDAPAAAPAAAAAAAAADDDLAPAEDVVFWTGESSGSAAGDTAGAASDRPALRPRRASAPMQLLVDQNQPSNVPMILGLVALIAALGAGGWYAYSRGMFGRFGLAPAAAESTAARGGAAAVPAPAPPAPPAAESLPWAVQVAAVGTLADAFAAADTLEARGLPAIIAPLRIPGRTAVYRVFAGPYASAARADSALMPLRAAAAPGAATAPGRSVSVPFSLALGAGLTREAARAEQLRLRQAGVPVFVLGQADGTFRLYAGAYDAAVQAALLQDLLTPTGSAGDLVPRAGYVP